MYYGTFSSQIEWNNPTSLHDSSSEINDESIATNDKYENQWPFLDILKLAMTYAQHFIDRWTIVHHRRSWMCR